MNRLYSTLVLLLVAWAASAQDTVKTKKVKILPVPAFGYAPETRTNVGAVALFTFHLYKDTITRTSNAKIKFNYTWNRQSIFESEWNYFFREERWFTKGRLNYSKFPDLYYGVGPETPDSNKLGFNSNRFLSEAYGLKKIGNKLFTGLNVKYTSYSKVSDTNTRIAYAELNNAKVMGIGYTLMKDTRNSLLTPSDGVYYFFNSVYDFSKTNYGEIVLDLRRYHSWNNKVTLAGRFYNAFVVGTPPFYDYSVLGGDRFVRGYYYGRYRDNYLSTLQGECRFVVVWRVGLAAFGGLSSIYSPANNFKTDNVMVNYGGGLRFMMDKKDKTNLRLDYAIGSNGNNGFYVAFGESF